VGLHDKTGDKLLDADNGDIQVIPCPQVQAHAKATTASRLLSSLKRFYQYALAQNRIKADPTPTSICRSCTPVCLKPSRAGRGKAAGGARTDTVLGLRNRTMLEILYASGLRCPSLSRSRFSR
jgi:integrase/recombinase XerD